MSQLANLTTETTKERVAVEIDLARNQIHAYAKMGLKMFASSSFQSHSIPMLHVLSQIDPNIPIYFIQTGFHFPETLKFRNRIIRDFGLTLINLTSPLSHSEQMSPTGKMLFATDPDRCCHFNKVLPMQLAMSENDLWINGVRKDQNANRSTFDYEERTAEGKLRFHPMLNWTSEMIEWYCEEHSLPKHPLHYEDYVSIGCEPCTRKASSFESYDEREGRWAGLNKTECGLHTQLIEK